MDELISKLSGLISSPEGAQQIKSLLGALAPVSDSHPSSDSQDDASLQKMPPTSAVESSQSSPLSGIDPKMIMTIGEVMRAMNDKSDSRIALLESLKPFMRGRRASGIESAMRIMQITKLSGILSNPKGGR